MSGDKTKHIYGKWYTPTEAYKIEAYLLHNSKTGERWEWEDASGGSVQLS